MMTTGKRLLRKVHSYSEKLQAVSDDHRLAIVYLLAHEPMTVRDITLNLPLSHSLASHHSNALYKAGWVTREKIGRTVEYALNKKSLSVLSDFLAQTPIARAT